MNAVLVGLALGAASVAPAQVPVYTATASVRVAPAPWTPVCVTPAPVVVAPPVYVAPAPVVVVPPVYVAPPVCVAPAPVRVVRPAPITVGIGFGFGGRGWAVGGFVGPLVGGCVW